ncbi:hypothetical protein [Anabaena azotica]|uniref:Uncharacterized protein n=1 Tax=Anabaena azotica FACHB-119 TaxID=947527 RepID=A0ABR8CXF0_9NOST|nr:hypothetical protein [Anabaena azotica]MBD2499615.1 hypothetical protein [Anabaena azotica FACHB-119]
MLYARKFNNLGLMLLLVVGLWGCDNLKMTVSPGGNISFGRNVTAIGNIKPTQDQQTTVYIQGRVEQRVPLLQGQVYQVNDSTGSIWVVSKQNNLKEGELATFRGKVRYESITIAGQQFGEVYLIEE